MQRPPRVTVLGAGVVGLTTAHVLERAGHEVRVVADRIAANTSSRVAGAIWLPYLVDGDSRAPTWARETYAWLLEGARRTGFGVGGSVPLYLLVNERKDDPGLRAALPAGTELRWCDLAELPDLLREHGASTGARGAWVTRSPVVSPTPHLSWLRAQLADCAFEEKTVASLAAADGEFLINCTGRRARALTEDLDLLPVLGQLVVATGDELPREYAFVDDRVEDEVMYLVPRGREVVLGGYSARVDATEPTPWTLPTAPPPDLEIGRAILERFERAGAGPMGQIEQSAEWRPARISETVRVEPDSRLPRVFHNYGHGGSGFTLAYGCARAVLRWIQGQE